VEFGPIRVGVVFLFGVSRIAHVVSPEPNEPQWRPALARCENDSENLRVFSRIGGQWKYVEVGSSARARTPIPRTSRVRPSVSSDLRGSPPISTSSEFTPRGEALAFSARSEPFSGSARGTARRPRSGDRSPTTKGSRRRVPNFTSVPHRHSHRDPLPGLGLSVPAIRSFRRGGTSRNHRMCGSPPGALYPGLPGGLRASRHWYPLRDDPMRFHRVEDLFKWMHGL
jgi:hypothetical protein